jgi:seryl-tRNA synthetase
MNDDLPIPPSRLDPALAPSELPTLGSSTIYRMCEELIALRERNTRQHQFFEQAMQKSRDAIQTSFNSFAADTQRAYQQLRQEVHGEKRVSLALLNELIELNQDLEHIVASRPKENDPEAAARWAEAVEVESRKVGAALLRHGVHPYDAVIGAPYNPALHERVGACRVEGMDALRIAEQREHGYASQQPEFVVRRPKVIVTE